MLGAHIVDGPRENSFDAHQFYGGISATAILHTVYKSYILANGVRYITSAQHSAQSKSLALSPIPTSTHASRDSVAFRQLGRCQAAEGIAWLEASLVAVGCSTAKFSDAALCEEYQHGKPQIREQDKMLQASQDHYSIADAQKAIQDGQITVRALVERYLKAIEELNPQLNAVTVVNEHALEDAEKLDVRHKHIFSSCCSIVESTRHL